MPHIVNQIVSRIHHIAVCPNNRCLPYNFTSRSKVEQLLC